MDTIKSDWSLSLCVAPNGSGAKDLTVQQLAGLTPLPDGRGGLEAARIAAYSRNNTTKSDFALVFSGDEVVGGAKSSHITLPPGVDTITIWVRFECEDPNGQVGFSGVQLEVLSAIANPKPPEQILREEHEEEVRFLRHAEKAIRNRP